MNLTNNAARLLELLITNKQGAVYTMEATPIYNKLRMDKNTLTNAIHCLLQNGINVTTFSTERDIHRIQLNARNEVLKKYIYEMEKN